MCPAPPPSRHLAPAGKATSARVPPGVLLLSIDISWRPDVARQQHISSSARVDSWLDSWHAGAL